MLRFYDGFDHYAIGDITGKWSGGSFVTSTISSATVRTGVGALALGRTAAGQGDTVTLGVGVLAPTLIIGFALRFNAPTAPADQFILCFGDGTVSAGFQVGLRLMSTGILQVWRGGASTNLGNSSTTSGTQLGASGSALALNQWNYLEVKTTIHDTLGTVEVRVNGSNSGWINLTAQDTKFTANAYANVVGLGGSPTAAQVLFYDDLYLADTVAGDGIVDFLGPQTIQTVIASPGNGSQTDFTPSTGTDHGALVDEATPTGDTDYNASSTVGHHDTYNFPPLGATGTVTAVQAVQWAKLDTAGARNVTGCTRIGTTTYDHSTPVAIDTTYRAVRSIWTKSPATSAFWSIPEIDAAEFGPVIQA